MRPRLYRRRVSRCRQWRRVRQYRQLGHVARPHGGDSGVGSGTGRPGCRRVGHGPVRRYRRAGRAFRRRGGHRGPLRDTGRAGDRTLPARPSRPALSARGFADFDPGLEIGGVILNGVASERHLRTATEGLASAGIARLGWLPRREKFAFQDRHLGLVQARERHDLAKEIAALCRSGRRDRRSRPDRSPGPADPRNGSRRCRTGCDARARSAGPADCARRRRRLLLHLSAHDGGVAPAGYGDLSFFAARR